MILVILVLFLAALAFCGWGLYISVRLIFRSASRLFAPTFGPPAGPRQDGPRMPATADAPTTRPDIPGWTDKLVADHLAICATCRTSYVEGTLSLLEPETISRIVALVEAHDAPVVTP